MVLSLILQNAAREVRMKFSADSDGIWRLPVLIRFVGSRLWSFGCLIFWICRGREAGYLLRTALEFVKNCRVEFLRRMIGFDQSTELSRPSRTFRSTHWETRQELERNDFTFDIFFLLLMADAGGLDY